MNALVLFAALVALAALGCGRYGPPRRAEAETPLVVVTPASAPVTPEEQCEAPPP